MKYKIRYVERKGYSEYVQEIYLSDNKLRFKVFSPTRKPLTLNLNQAIGVLKHHIKDFPMNNLYQFKIEVIE